MINSQLTTVMYHYVRPMPDPDFPYLKACDLARFIAQLDYLQENYRVVGWPDVAAHLGGKASLPDRACLLTFDDGLRDAYTHIYPLLCRRGLSGLFFPMARTPEQGLAGVQTLQLIANKFSDPVEFESMLFAKLSAGERDQFMTDIAREKAEYPPDRFGENKLRSLRRVINTYMFRELEPVLEEICRERIGEPKELGRAFYLGDGDIREMVAGGMHFGGHGITHYRMTRLTPDELHKELAASREFLAPYTSGPLALSYPYGDHNDAVMAAVRTAGFVAAFADKGEGLADSVYALPRVDTIHVPPK